MTNFIPIFPLAIVVYPGELLNLHIFEERYKQLINECFVEKKPFGIPAVINNEIAETGTLVQITEIAEIYEDGKMDIRTEGTEVFRILQVIESIPEKLYSGAIVNYPANEITRHEMLTQRVLTAIREMHKMLKVTKDFKKTDADICSYDLAHHVGLSLEEEYEFLGLLREDQRLEYLKRHLAKMLPVLNSLEVIKERIKMNGHFRELKGFDFHAE